MQLLSSPLRPRRPGEWTEGHAILFIVTLAARGSVTLAARDAGMSRKSAYALRQRDPHFARAWDAALKAAAADASAKRAKGDNPHLAAPSTSSSANACPGSPKRQASARPNWQDRLLAELRRSGRDSVMCGALRHLAPRPASR